MYMVVHFVRPDRMYLTWMMVLFLLKITETKDVKTVFCGGIFINETSGQIQVPTTGRQYDIFMHCRWEIVATKDRRITIQSSEFAIEQSQGCTWDYLEIRDGSEETNATLGRFCGYKQLSLISESNKLYLYFVTDGSFQEKGFQLSFNTVPIASSPAACNSVITDDRYISSPGYPSFYPKNTFCLYWIKFPGTDGIDIDVKYLDVRDETCLFDRVEVYDGRTTHDNKLTSFCGKSKDLIYNTEKSSILLKFTSDYFEEGRGFRAYIKSKTKDNSKTNIMQRSTGNVHTPGIVAKESYEKSQTGCNRTLQTEVNGTLTSPQYPNVYPNNAHCVTVIRSPLDGHVIRLNVTFLEVEASDNCTFDSLTIYASDNKDSDVLAKLCGLTEKEYTYESYSGSIRLEFKSDSMIRWRGYQANFQLLPKRVCYPSCVAGTVCVNSNGYYTCIPGFSCPVDICYHGKCVQNSHGAFKCYCHHGYTGPFCRSRRNEKNSTGITFTKTPTDHMVKRGDRKILECQTDSRDAQYIWLHENLLLETDDNHITIYPGGVLDINNFNEDLEGLYKCLASTPSNFVETEFRLTLKEACELAVEVSPKDTIAKIGTTALFSCFVPAATQIKWYKDNRALTSSHISIIGGGFYLKIESIKMNDEGNYSCLAEGENGCAAERGASLTVDSTQEEQECGTPYLPDYSLVPQLSSRISNGRMVTQETTAWHVIIRERIKKKTFCGGTLVSDTWIVTAAHCIAHYPREFKRPFKKANVELYLGTDNCNGQKGIKNRIKRIILHPDFGQRALYDNDMALIEMEDAVNFTDRIRPLCLKPSHVISNMFLTRKVGRKVGRVIGCGQLYENMDETPDKIHDVYVPTVNREVCMDANIGSGNFTDSMFCAGYERAMFGDACYGDSGGSLSMQQSENHPWVFVGVVSWGVGCDRPGHYGYYTNVASFYDWIQGVIAKNSTEKN